MSAAGSYEDRWPSVPWREPLPVKLMDSDTRYYACRICVARHGLRAREIAVTSFAFRCEADCLAHLASAHTDEVIQRPSEMTGRRTPDS